MRKLSAQEPHMTTYNIFQTERTDFLHSIEEGLNAHNAHILPNTPSRRPANFIVEMPGGSCGGGIKASYVGRHFFISWLYVEDTLRGRGLGRELIQTAEAFAHDKGCTAVFVDTMSFQAPAFYEDLGYVEVSRIVDFYEGYDRIFFKKRLI